MARRFAALAHPARVEILCHLSVAGACCCKDVVGQMPLAQSTVSQHLKVLVEAGLVRLTPVGQSSRYEINPVALLEIGTAVDDLLSLCAPGADSNDNRD
nr:metalloregulator ArsR/SmtB family transcription factor [Chelativorans sp. Marseille-P2723]